MLVIEETVSTNLDHFKIKSITTTMILSEEELLTLPDQLGKELTPTDIIVTDKETTGTK